MHLHFEQNISSRTECTIHSLSWMGKVPDSLPGDVAGGWKLNRGQYYSEGWLSSGNAKGIVGVTFTTSHCRKYEPPNRSNFNLRGHRSEVVLVRWNEPYQKLATCDSRGIIFVWIKHEGRWSIELINDRNSQVTDFAWSHDGRMALICYCDGFVLVGSVAGQRYWSTLLNDLDSAAITCGVWSPDDQKVMFGTTDGRMIVMSSTGAFVCQITILESMEITTLAWSCEKFNMDETDGNQDSGVKVTAESGANSSSDKVHTLAVCFKLGAIYLMNNYDDVCPKVIQTMLTGLRMDWSNCGEYLAVGGFTRMPNLQCNNEIHFYSPSAELRHSVSVPAQGKPLTALCWGHNDRRLFVAAGHHLHVAWIIKPVPSLQYLSQRCVKHVTKNDRSISLLPLPTALSASVQALFSPTVKSYIPDPFKLREFVSTPPPGAERLFCTMVRHGEDTSGGHYTLYLEYLGGMIPLLKGKRASKLRPDFVIFDPKIKAKSVRNDDTTTTAPDEYDMSSSSSMSDSDFETDGCGGSPRLPRKRRQKANFRPGRIERSTTYRTLNDLFFNDNLPENSKLVEVTSNIWGTKFRITGVAAHLPDDMGNVLYKTSLLHLQPRQMTVTITEIPRDQSLLSQDRNFSPTGLGDEEPDQMSLLDGLLSGVHNEHYTQNSSANIDNHHDLNQDMEIISVDVLTNHCELSCHIEETAERNSINSSLGLYSDRQNKPVCMKTKLSPASETHPQNSHAFNTVDATVIRDSYIREDVRPKVPIQQPSFCANQNVSSESGLLSLTMNTNESSNCARLTYESYMSTASPKSLSSHSENLNSHATSRSGSIAEQAVPQLNSPEVGNYFFMNGNADSGNCDIGVDSQENVHKHAPSLVDRLFPGDPMCEAPRWADPAFIGLTHVDDIDPSALNSSVYESNSICDSSQIVVTPTSEKRLYLEGSQDQDSKETETCEPIKSFGVSGQCSMMHDQACRQSNVDTDDDNLSYVTSNSLPDSTQRKHSIDDTSAHKYNGTESLKAIKKLKSPLEKIVLSQSASLPATPVRSLHKLDSPTRKLREDLRASKCRHHSPLFAKKSKYSAQLESSDDDFSSSAEDVNLAFNFKGLESFQKAQFKQKLKRVRGSGEDKKAGTRYKHQFAMHNKAPLWNENSQVYQLDFGGRVTQESAKNFQIEFKGKQVMQFGRIDSNAYTLDFQYPFTAIQAFAVALANVTQRLK